MFLFAASLFFYGSWNPWFLALLLLSISANFIWGILINEALKSNDDAKALTWLRFGIAANLIILGAFKYSYFVLDNVALLVGSRIDVGAIMLPLGISFFTFEQIAYLVDVRRLRHCERDWLRYSLFVAFFPRLVAGPILRGTEILPQLEAPPPDRNQRLDLAVGLSIFAIGLFKKAFLADGVAPYTVLAFSGATHGNIDLVAAWVGALAYTCQLYFDFSGYSDMAIGAARCFGFRLPANFASPYRSTSIIEFWRRWHITLSRFLRDYLYVSLGGNRRGAGRRYLNLMLTMLLGGLWHGAGWTFVVWGGLHGGYLMINHGWRKICSRSRRIEQVARHPFGRGISWLLTFIAVVVAWVFFRAPDLPTAVALVASMVGANGLTIPAGLLAALGPLAGWLEAVGVRAGGGSGTQLLSGFFWVVCCLFIALGFPNSQTIMAHFRPTVDDNENPAVGRLHWKPTRSWATAVAAIALTGVLSLSRAGEFLYWQF